MSATTTPTTFSDLYTDVLNRVRANSSDTTSIQIAKRLVNQGLHDVHIVRNWPWAERRARLNTNATYTTGTVAIALSARTTVTGTDTLWNTAVTGMGFNNVRAGGKIRFDSSDIYTVDSVASDTSLTLTERYTGTAALSGDTYTYFEDEYALASDFWRLVDMRQFSDVVDIPVYSRMDFYRRFPRNSTLGNPLGCTIIDLAPSGSVSPQPRVLFHPAPNSVMTIPYRYITSNLAVSSAGAAQTQLSADADEPIIPLRYRHVLIFYAIAHWYRDRKDDARAQSANAEYVDLVRRMAGDLAPEHDTARIIRRQPMRRNFSARGATRYGIGTRFDEMRD